MCASAEAFPTVNGASPAAQPAAFGLETTDFCSPPWGVSVTVVMGAEGGMGRLRDGVCGE